MAIKGANSRVVTESQYSEPALTSDNNNIFNTTHQKKLYTYFEVISAGYAYVFYADQKMTKVNTFCLLIASFRCIQHDV